MRLLITFYVFGILLSLKTLHGMINDQEFANKRPDVQTTNFFVFGIFFSFLSWSVIFLSFYRQTKAIKRAIDEIRKTKIS